MDACDKQPLPSPSNPLFDGKPGQRRRNAHDSPPPPNVPRGTSTGPSRSPPFLPLAPGSTRLSSPKSAGGLSSHIPHPRPPNLVRPGCPTWNLWTRIPHPSSLASCISPRWAPSRNSFPPNGFHRSALNHLPSTPRWTHGPTACSVDRPVRYSAILSIHQEL